VLCEATLFSGIRNDLVCGGGGGRPPGSVSHTFNMIYSRWCIKSDKAQQSGHTQHTFFIYSYSSLFRLVTEPSSDVHVDIKQDILSAKNVKKSSSLYYTLLIQRKILRNILALKSVFCFMSA
jgi:hypothetical protein